MTHRTALPLFLALMSLPTLSHSVTPETNASGTYEIIVCKESCSFSDMTNVFARGIVVLDDHRLPTRDGTQVEPSFIGPNEVARACYSMNVLRKADSFAGLSKQGISSWRMSGGVIEFSIFRSADAGYEVSAHLNGAELFGYGSSWGAGVAAPHYTNDTIVGKRVGPPDIKNCTPALQQSQK